MKHHTLPAFIRLSLVSSLTLTVCLVSVGFGIGQVGRKILTAQELRLTDRNGKARVLIAVSASDDTPSVKLLDKRGNAQVTIALDNNGAVHLTGMPVPSKGPQVAASTANSVPTPSGHIYQSPLNTPPPPPAIKATAIRDSRHVLQTDPPKSLQFERASIKNGQSADRKIGYGACKIECQVKNISVRSVASIIVKANFYDRDGQFMDEEVAFLANLPAGDIWKFDIESDNNNAVAGKIVSIQAVE